MPATLLPGFQNLKDIVNTRLPEVGVEMSEEAVNRSIAVYNETTNRMMALFADTTTDYMKRYKQLAVAEVAAADEIGLGREVQGWSYYDLAFPINKFVGRIGWTHEEFIKATVQDLNDRTTIMLDGFKRRKRNQIMQALFNNTNLSFIDKEKGTLSVKPLANGDATEYLLFAGAEDAPTTVQHYKTFSAMDNANAPFSDIHDTLVRYPENGGDLQNGKVICFINTAQKAAVKALTNFIEESDPDIIQGVNTDRLVGSLGTAVPGEVIGKCDECWIVVWDYVPANYILSICTGGNRPLAMRIPEYTQLQGLSAEGEIEKFPFYERHYYERYGFGAHNRLSARIDQLTGGSYTVPTVYARSLA